MVSLQEETCALQLGTTSKSVGSSMARLLTAAAQGNENYTGSAARDTAGALKVLTQAVRGVAATTKNHQLQNTILQNAQDVMDKSANLIEEARKAVQQPNNPDNQTRLTQVRGAGTVQAYWEAKAHWNAPLVPVIVNTSGAEPCIFLGKKVNNVADDVWFLASPNQFNMSRVKVNLKEFSFYVFCILFHWSPCKRAATISMA